MFCKKVIRKDELSVVLYYRVGQGEEQREKSENIRKKTHDKDGEQKQKEKHEEKSCCIYYAWLTHFKDPPAK